MSHVVCSQWVREFRNSETWCFTREVPTHLKMFGKSTRGFSCPDHNLVTQKCEVFKLGCVGTFELFIELV